MARVKLAIAAAAAGLCWSCGSTAPPPTPAAQTDPTADSQYGRSVDQLAAMVQQAERLFQAGQNDDASGVIQRAQGLQARVLAAPRPTLAAMEAASDLDDLYGRMMMANKQYGWARDFFQKNAVRWKSWKPPTPETEKRRADALAKVRECEAKM
jgi:hypothetical protein